MGTNKFSWESLLKNCREKKEDKRFKQRNDDRSFSKVDYDKICYWSSFRRLQDKAQVFPLESEDFVRTRLTHSIEVGCIAEALGTSFIETIKYKEERNDAKFIKLLDNIPLILRSAALIHDLGNPPFGHLGEDIISEWFINNLDKYTYNVNEKKIEKIGISTGVNTLKNFLGELSNDFINFDGNAQALRIVSKLQNKIPNKIGANLSYPLLATIIKYPDNFECGKNKKGYFYSEKSLYCDIQKELKLEGKRHPLTFLLEAADDLAYLFSDLEDSVKKGLITINDISSKLKSLNNSNATTKGVVDLLSAKCSIYEKNEDPYYSIQIICNNMRGICISRVKDAMREKYYEMMNGELKQDLLSVSKCGSVIDAIRELLKSKVYYSKDIVTKKIISRKVIYGLMEVLIPSTINSFYQEANDKSEYLNKLLLSKNFERICKHSIELISENSTEDNIRLQIYNILFLIIDFITGMTDSYAEKIYNILC